MRRIVLWVASTVTIVVLLFGYHTSTNQPSSAATSNSSTPTPSSTTEPGSSPSSSSTPSATTNPSSSSPSPTASSTPTTSSTKAKTYTGSVAQTRWGPVQAQITVAGDKITAVDVLQYPYENRRDQELNDYALPILVQETLDAQSANIDMVSGATVTSDGYLESLQAALDGAGR
jgi:uncharacterized protein with FMN-binding domain